MSLSIEYKNYTEYLFAKIVGEWKQPDMNLLLEDLKINAVKFNKNYILIDAFKLTLPNTEFVRFSTGEKIASIFSYPYKIATFSQSELINKFAETVAVNRGANFKVFHSESEAKEWLLSKS